MAAMIRREGSSQHHPARVIRGTSRRRDDRPIGFRWEWRTFGDLGAAGERLGALEPESVGESDEIYLLSAEGVDAVKLRDGLMDVKHLAQVGAQGLELWKPVMKAPLPIAGPDARIVFDALRVDATISRDAYALADLEGPSVRAVPVHKTRRHFTLAGCMAELTDLAVGPRSTRTIALESEEPARVIAARDELGLASRPNVSVPRGLKALV
jgi:exopolyphosphatase / guanosine-5'-triphosphate,3'-diphosphate pyrophosphatase